MIIQYLRKPPRLDYLDKWLKKPSVNVLDIGCGNHAPSITKKYYPDIKYYGLDKNKSYNFDKFDFKCMEYFYEIDLSDINNFKNIPDNYFDCIIMSHVIEHLEQGEIIIKHLLNKLRKNGIIYIEFPSLHSIHLPNMRDTLNFYDDPSHIRMYKVKEIVNILEENGFIIIKSGIRCSLKKIFLLPLYFISSLVRKGYISSSVFWDITGFASQVIAIKKQ